MRHRFEKMHGLGNDFVIVDAREQPLLLTPAMVSAIADRRTGIGCDQLIVLEPSKNADLRMRIWNSDGGEVEACGNATRCVVELTGASRIDSDGGLIEGRKLEGEVEVILEQPRFGWKEIPLAYPMDTSALPLAWGPLERPMAVNVGNPHVVFFVDDPAGFRLEELGPMIEKDGIFPERINVNLASVDAGNIRLRTFERGAGLTLACGTGACAAAVAAIASKRATSPLKVTMAGGSLVISWRAGKPIIMRGSAAHVFTGEIDLETFH